MEDSGLVACSRCRWHIKVTEARCPRCGVRCGRARGPVGATVVLLGIALAACGPDDGVDDSAGSASQGTSTPTATDSDSSSTSMTSASSDSATSSTTTASTSDSTTQSMTTAQPPYGVPDTTGGEDTTDPTTGGETETDTDDSSTGNPTTGAEPLYGAGISDDDPPAR